MCSESIASSAILAPSTASAASCVLSTPPSVIAIATLSFDMVVVMPVLPWKVRVSPVLNVSVFGVAALSLIVNEPEGIAAQES